MRARTITLALTAGLLAAVTSCSSTTATPAAGSAVSTGTTAVAQASAPAPSKAAAADAAAVTAKLTGAIPTVKLTVTYDGTTDPNTRLGRPHQYTSKTAFDDTRVSTTPKAKEDEVSGHRDSISYGGTVEIFANEADAKAWTDYVDAAQQAISGLSRPDYIARQGATVVRVSHLLTADQAKEYEKAIG